ncbi:endoribonuclease L-PSP [Colletotrichum graminicola M1.001]|uniref:Endoribonuclease L-PSP n=1 Tax=Colletotrichum graminicola (strain M1.001 / M2 / FGSC 10212) TaxID=645133 RepID=E3QY69_COLGM|nr:endoribonuclease L-PSP [Colletotrichum graminicola M1.001]EFQ35807.1 endoribonuclease L-PSP [Colletotrichum graminicola M1.001]
MACQTNSEAEDRPFGPLPRTSSPSSIIGADQRGRPEAQGLPRVEDGKVLDAVVVGGSCNGIANAIRLDAAGAEIAVFDMEARAGGNWSTKRYEGVMLHHPAFMVQLPLFPVPEGEGYPNYLTGQDLTRYYSSAVERLRLPFFGGVEVVGNAWDEGAGLWTVTVKDVATGAAARLRARNVVVSTGLTVTDQNPRVTALAGRETFAGPVQHTAAYRNPEAYRGRRVVVVGSGNSAHDVAATLARDGGVASVTLLQRSPTVLLDFDAVGPAFARRYGGQTPVDTADFLEGALPLGVVRDVTRAGFRALIAASEERNRALEGVGYMLDREPCLMTRVFEEKGRAFYADQPGTFKLVLDGRIKVARGEARGFVERGLVVVDRQTGRERVVEADGVVLATGFEVMDMPRRYKNKGFVDADTADRLVNVNENGVDAEGEQPGLTTFSGLLFRKRKKNAHSCIVIGFAQKKTMASTLPPRVERTTIAGSIEIPRMLHGLWQLAGGHDRDVDVAAAAEAMGPLIDVGLDGFDMADHYGPAELVVGRHNLTSSRRPITAFTKWCPPESGDRSFATAEAAVDLALRRMAQERVALMQYHIWDYSDDTYLCNLAHLGALQRQGKISHVGVTNVDAAHLELLLDSGYAIATNQVSCSVVDRRLVRGRMAGVCARRGVGVLAYGTLLGGFLSEKWIGAPEPTSAEGLNWSLRKYLRFIRAAGGWAAFQGVLKAVAAVAEKHGVPVAAVATRWVLDIPVVKAVIVGARLSGESGKYTAGNLAAFGLSLDDEDRTAIAKAQEALADIPGDCGDEYRRAPFLTAAGDLSDHVKGGDGERRRREVEEAVTGGGRVEYRTGSKWEPVAGYSRAVRVGSVIRVSGTTANPPTELGSQLAAVGGESARSQTVAVLDTIERAVRRLGGSMSDVVRTRVMIRREEDVEEVSEAHGWVFQCHGVRPANTLTTAGLIGDEMLVEIEAEAVVGSSESVLVVE